MNRVIIELTARQLLGKRRTLLLFAFAMLPVAIAILYRASSQDTNQPRWTSMALGSRLIVGTLLPLCSLVFGTAAMGSEIEDGTAVYLLSKPIPRWRIIGSKLFVAWVATAVLVALATVIAQTIAIHGAAPQGIVPGFVVAVVAGAFVYTALFLMLSIFTSRALISGLLYVFFWEGLLTNLFTGLRVFSVRQYTLGIAHGIADTSEATFSAKLDGPEAAILLLIVAALATFFAVRRLQRWEIGEST